MSSCVSQKFSEISKRTVHRRRISKEFLLSLECRLSWLRSLSWMYLVSNLKWRFDLIRFRVARRCGGDFGQPFFIVPSISSVPRRSKPSSGRVSTSAPPLAPALRQPRQPPTPRPHRLSSALTCRVPRCFLASPRGLLASLRSRQAVFTRE
jgi:hypothetical protein